MSRFKPYTRFARVYDLMGGDRFSTRMVEYTHRLLKKFRYHPKEVLDLCCGTGTAALLFAESGFAMTGLDRSEDMLREARHKAAARKLPLNLVHQALPNFAIKEKRGKILKKFHLVTCFYDSLNYILEEKELAETFGNVNLHLKPDGLFIFDMNTPRALKFLWGAKVYAGCHSGIAWIWQSIYYDRAKTADLRATFFVQHGKHWQMFEEIHTEKAYNNSTIKKLLHRSGFEISGFYDCFKFHKPGSKSFRIAVVAQKKREMK